MRKAKQSFHQKLLPSALKLAPRTTLALVGVLICLGGAGYFATKLNLVSAATAPTLIICSHGTKNGVLCLNRYRGETGVGASVVGYSASYDLNERFQFQELAGMCNHGRVSSTCPFTVGTGLNNRYINDEIVQIRDYGTGLCVGNYSFDTSQTAEVGCNSTAGSGGGNGTIFVHNVTGGGGTLDYLESRYWSNHYGKPAWLCGYGYASDPRPLLSGTTTDFGGGCQWRYK